MDFPSEHEWVLQNVGFSCLLLASIDLANLPLTHLSHIWLEGRSSWDPQYGLKMPISKFEPVVWLIGVQMEKSSKKMGSIFLKNHQSLFAFPLTSLNLALNSELQCRSMSPILKHKRGILHSKEEGVSKNCFCMSWSLQTCDQSLSVASQWHWHTSYHWIVCLHP